MRGALEALERSWTATRGLASVVRTIVINDNGVFLGSTKLAPQARGYEARIHALASYFYGRAAPLSLARTLEAASEDYLAGDKAKSAMRLALAIPAPVGDAEDCRKLHFATGLLDAGSISSRGLLSLVGIDCREHDALAKRYNPDEPRVDAGNRDGGQWTSGAAGSPTQDKEKTPRSRGEQLAVSMPEGCEGEWAWAMDYCEELLLSPNPSRSLTGGHTTTIGCARGFVSERCGGNKV